MTGTDPRSVGELLMECDLTARRLLLDPDALDAAAMLSRHTKTRPRPCSMRLWTPVPV